MSDFWLENPTKFRKWYLENYVEEFDLDRIDNDGPYDPGNCRFLSRRDNSRNRRNTRFVEIYGKKKSWSEWADDARCKTTLHSLTQRLENGWEPEKALTTPLNDYIPLYTGFGETKSAAEWARDSRCVVNTKTLWYRLKKGWHVEQAILSPSQIKK